jgi:hypothetical protein
MSCTRCTSENVKTFNGEIAIHFPGLSGLDKGHVFAFRKLVVCLDCGHTIFVVPDAQLQELRDGALSAHEDPIVN